MKASPELRLQTQTLRIPALFPFQSLVPGTKDPQSSPAPGSCPSPNPVSSCPTYPLPFSKPCWGEGSPPAPDPHGHLHPLRILHELCKSLGLNLTKFTQYDENTWIEVSEVKLRNYVVEKMPEKLGYKLSPKEKGRSPEEIYQMALNRVGASASPAAPFPCPVLPCPHASS